MLLNFSLVLLLSTCLAVAQETQGNNRPDYCSLPPVMPADKKCKAFILKWTFNETACVSYGYGGCHGTKNLFDTEADCQAACPSSSVAVPQRKQSDGSTPPSSASGPSVHPQHQYLLAFINCLYSFCFLLTRYF